MADDDLSDFERASFTHDGKTRTIFRKGSGPAVIVMAEIPGITPGVAEFARRIPEIGCTAVMPHLFGDPGLRPRRPRPRRRASARWSRPSPRICISREFTVLATGKSSPVIDWLRALAADEHARCGGPGVGAIGMCFTGGFALAMATHPEPARARPQSAVAAVRPAVEEAERAQHRHLSPKNSPS